MPNYTENFNLIKPLPKDQYDVQHFNDNMDILDGTLKSHQEQITLQKETMASTKEEINSTLASMQGDIDTIEQNTSEEALKNKIDEALSDNLDEKIATQVSSEIDSRSLISQETFNPVQEKVSTLETNLNQTNENVTSLSNTLTEVQESIATINETNTAQNEKISNLEEDVKTLDPEAFKEIQEMQKDLEAKMYAQPGLVLKFPDEYSEISITIKADQPLFLTWGDSDSFQVITPSSSSTTLTHYYRSAAENRKYAYCAIYAIYDFNLLSFSYSGVCSEVWVCDKILSLPSSFLEDKSSLDRVYFISKNLTQLPSYCLNYSSASYVYLADNIAKLGYYALSRMPNLTTITLPEALNYYDENFLYYNYFTSVYFRQPIFTAYSYSQALRRYTPNKYVYYYSTNSTALRASVTTNTNTYFSYNKNYISYQQVEEVLNAPDKDILDYIPRGVDTYYELLKPPAQTTEIESQINTLTSDVTTIKTDISLLKTKDINLQQQLDYLFIAMFPTFASRLSFKYNISSSTLIIPQLSQDEQYGIIKYNDVYSGSTLLNRSITSPTLSSSSGNISIASAYLDLIDEHFKNNTYMTSIDLSKAVLNTFGNSVFMNCTSLISASLPETLEQIPNQAFSGCTNLKQCEIPRAVRIIGESAFLNDSALTNIILIYNSNLREIQANAFNGCLNLEIVRLPYALFTIKENAFANCGQVKMYFDGKAEDFSSMVVLEEGWNAGSSITIFDKDEKVIDLE